MSTHRTECSSASGHGDSFPSHPAATVGVEVEVEEKEMCDPGELCGKAGKKRKLVSRKKRADLMSSDVMDGNSVNGNSTEAVKLKKRRRT